MKPLMIAAALALLTFTGCGVSINTGGSSGPSEEDVAGLLRDHSIYLPECVKSTNGSDRDFDCTGQAGESDATMTLEVTVAESGKTVVITHCEGPEGTGWREGPCEGINGGTSEGPIGGYPLEGE